MARSNNIQNIQEKTQEIKNLAADTVTKGIQKTRELHFYLLKFAFRIAIFISCFGLYIYDRELLGKFMNTPFWQKFTLVHVIWVFFMIIMISHLIPNNRLTMAWQKARETAFRPAEHYNELELMKFAQDKNVRAWRVMLVWISFNAIFGVLYLIGIISQSDLLMLSVFYFLSDYICILLFCPFQKFIMKSKCCINCRIYDWGHFMMFTPMLFIRNFYSWSLFFTSLVVLIHWEIIYAKHPERFWEGSNLTLRCENCKEKTCYIKRRGRRHEIF